MTYLIKSMTQFLMRETNDSRGNRLFAEFSGYIIVEFTFWIVNSMKKGLLLTAFLTTLILDMGVGPVLIVFGAVNLSKQTSYPSAAWLMVRGIVNCVQFLIVMILTWIVSRTKGQFSRKEETLLVARLLTTNPLAYLYYLLILFGIVWNILGSCWIAAAFRHYSVGFASCYLVGVILAWISVIASPLFVFSGGLFYGKIKKNTMAVEPSTVQLVPIEDASVSITNILNNLHNEGISITAEDILHLSKQQDLNHQLPAISLTEDEKPVIVSDILPSTGIDERVSLLDTLITQQGTNQGVIFFQRDVLDDERPMAESAWHQSISQEIEFAPVEVRNDVTVVERVMQQGSGSGQVMQRESEGGQVMQQGSEVMQRESEQREEMKERKEETHQPNAREEQKEINHNVPTMEESKQIAPKKKKKGKKYSNPKERVVLPDEPIALPPTQIHSLSSPPVDDEYVDLSIQMRDAMNRGDFEHNVEDVNVFGSIVS